MFVTLYHDIEYWIVCCATRLLVVIWEQATPCDREWICPQSATCSSCTMPTVDEFIRRYATYTPRCHVIPMRYIVLPSFSQIFALYGGHLDSYLIHGSLGPPDPTLQMASRSSLPFFHNTLVTDRPRKHSKRATWPNDVVMLHIDKYSGLEVNFIHGV